MLSQSQWVTTVGESRLRQTLREEREDNNAAAAKLIDRVIEQEIKILHFKNYPRIICKFLIIVKRLSVMFISFFLFTWDDDQWRKLLQELRYKPRSRVNQIVLHYWDLLDV